MKKLNIGNDYYALPNGRIFNSKTNNIVNHRLNRNGYYIVNLSISGKCKTFLEHRLIAEAFVLNPNNYPVVNHIDGNKTNNIPENLEWTTLSGNARHAVKTGLFVGTNEHGFKMKISDEEAEEIRKLYKDTNLSQEKIAKMYGVTKGTIGFILRGETHKREDLEIIKKRTSGKLSFEEVINIKQMIEDGLSAYKIADITGVPRSTISAIKYGRTYSYVHSDGEIKEDEKIKRVSFRRKINTNDIEDIFKLYYLEVMSCTEIADKYGVKREAIRRLILGLSYKEITSKLTEEYKDYG